MATLSCDLMFVFYDDLVHVLSLVFDALFIHRSVRYDVLIFDDRVMESMCMSMKIDGAWQRFIPFLALMLSVRLCHLKSFSAGRIFQWHRFLRINKLSSSLRVKLWSWIW